MTGEDTSRDYFAMESDSDSDCSVVITGESFIGERYVIRRPYRRLLLTMWLTLYRDHAELESFSDDFKVKVIDTTNSPIK